MRNAWWVSCLVAYGLAGCSKQTQLFDACVPGAVTVSVVTPVTYACHEPFRATLAVANGSCAQLTVQSIAIAGTVTTGNCTPPGPGTFKPTEATVEAGATTTILDFTGGNFCCTSPGCPASFQCDEHYTFTLTTSAGDLTATGDTHLSLDSCDEICK